MTCRKRIDDVETGEKSLTRDESGGWPDCCPGGIRHEGGVTLHLAFAWNVGTCRPDAKGEIQVGGPHEDESTEAGHRGGAIRSVRWAAHESGGFKSLRRSDEERRIQRRG
jgi:hypothetical protein